MSKDVPHIDDGRLHAWLDGELDRDAGPFAAAVRDHLESCDQCRSRLESARADRERARSILASTDRPLAAPTPFSDVVTRARAGVPERRRSPRRSSSVLLAWAASIAVVAGAGLLGRELVERRGRDLPGPIVSGRQEAPPQVAAEEREAKALLADEENAPDAAGKLAAEPVPDSRSLEVRERFDADLAAGAVRAGGADGHAGLGCWRLESDSIASESPGWLRLTGEPIPGRNDGALRLETDPAFPVAVDGPVAWMPVGADSVQLSIPPRVFRLAAEQGRLHGDSGVEGDPESKGSSGIRYGRVACPIP